MKIKQILRSHYDIIEEATRGCLGSVLSKLYARSIITGTVRDSQSYSKAMGEFEFKFSLISDMSQLKSHCQLFLESISQGGPTHDVVKNLAAEWGEELGMEFFETLPASFSFTPSPSPTSPPASKGIIIIINLIFTLIVIMHVETTEIVLKPFLKKTDERKVHKSLDELRARFPGLVTTFKSAFREKAAKNGQLATDASEWLKEYMTWSDDKVDNTLTDVFNKMRPYYDFLDCTLLLDMSKVFLQDVTFSDNGTIRNLCEAIQSHSLKVKALRASTTISTFRKVLQQKFEPFDNDLDNIPFIRIHLETVWERRSIDALYKLIEKLLPEKFQQSLTDHISIYPGSVVIKLIVLDSTADSLKEYVEGKLQFMRLVGIFSLYINKYAVLQEDENINFTFDLALLEAVTAGHNEAVKFLLQLETVNIDHTNEEGKTALMLACERGHEDIAHSLLSAGANVNLQDNNGWTALMRAIRHNHISVINMLLQANVWLKLPNGPAEILINACKSGDTQRVRLLLKDKVDPNAINNNEEGKTALMLACESGHEDIVHSLLFAGANVNLQDNAGWSALMTASEHNHISIIHKLLNANADPHLLASNGSNVLMIAAFIGYYDIVVLLINKCGVDPNYQREDGSTAFMAACNNGHIQIVELLLKERVDPNVQNNEGYNAFMFACQNGHIQIVKLLLKEQGNPNIQSKNGMTALMLACQYGHIPVVKLLLKERVDPNVQNKEGYTAFMLACQKGHIHIVKLLLKEQGNPNVESKNGVTALMLACQNGHMPIVEILLKEKVDPNVQNNEGMNAFILSCYRGHTQIVKLLLKEQVHPNVQTKNGTNAFMIACENGHTQIAKLLLKGRVDLNVQSKTGVTPFMLACQNGHIQIVKMLLRKNADTNVQNNDGYDAFMLSCVKGRKEIVEILLAEKVDPNVQQTNDYRGCNAFGLACQSGQTEIVKLLLKEQIDPTVHYKDGSNALMLACYNGHTQVVKLLLKHVDPNAQDKNGMNALMLACQNGHAPIVELLLNEQIDPNLQDVDGWNAFLRACHNGHTLIIKMLLDRQVDFSAQNNKGVNAFMLACAKGHTSIIKLLLKEQVNINAQSNDGSNAFMLACENGHIEIVKLLLTRQTDFTVRNKDGQNAFIFACINGHTPIVELLLILGQIDPNVQNNDGWNALMMACSNGHTQIVELLLKKKVNVNTQSNVGWNALMLACIEGYTEIVQLLLKEEVNCNAQANDGASALMLACNKGHKEIVHLLLKEKVNTKMQNNDGQNALWFACQDGHNTIVELFLNEQVDPNLQDVNGMNAFMVACQNGHSQIVKLLLKFQIHFDVQNSAGENALILACKNRHISIVELLLLKEQVDPDVRNNDGWNALMMACDKGYTKIVELLLQKKINVNTQSNNGWNALMLACKKGYTEIVQLLLKEEVNCNAKTDDGVSTLMLACDKGHKEIVQMLLKKQVALNVQTSKGLNAFISACSKGHTEIVEMLLMEHIDPNVQIKDNGWNAFMLACQDGYTSIVKLLLEKQVDPNVRNIDGWNAFMIACQNGYTQIAKLLLKEQVDPNSHNKNGWSALMAACYTGYIEIVQLLLDENVNLNAQKKDGVNAFIVACEAGHKEIVELLLMGGANPDVQADNGLTALVLACHKGHTQIVELLLKKQVNPNTCMISSSGLTPLMITCVTENSNSEIVKLLLAAGADPNLQFKSSNVPVTNGATALMFASARGDIKSVQLLLKAGAEPNLKTTMTGETALSSAIVHAHHEVVRELIKGGSSISDSYSHNDGQTTLTYTITQLCVMGLALSTKIPKSMVPESESIKKYFGNTMEPEEIIKKMEKIFSKDKAEAFLKTLHVLLQNIPQPDDDPASIIIASHIGCAPAVDMLLKAGYNPEAFLSSCRLDSFLNTNIDRGDWNALTIACNEGHTKIVELILQKRVDLKTAQVNALTPLMAACHTSSINLEIVKILLEAGADPNICIESPIMPYINGINPLMIASAHDRIQVDLVQLLINFGADPNITSMVTGETALSIAVESGHLEIVKELLQNGASTTDTISRDIDGKKIEFTMTQLCLERLITKSHLNRLVQLQPAELKEESKEIYGNDFTLSLEKINKKLLSINTEDTIEILRCIIDARSEPEDDPACLLMASLSGNKQAVDMLLNARHNPITPMSSSKHYQALYKGIPPFLYPSFIIPCIEGVLEGSIAETLLKAIGDPNTQQENGLTFLMIACKFCQFDIVRTLLVNGADPNICDSDGNNALHYILMSDSSEENKLVIIDMLLSMNMNVNARNTDGVTALMIASHKGYTEVIKLLGNADPNVTDKKGMTAVMFACMNGHHEVAEYLLMTYDADPLPTNKYGLSSLSYGAMGGHIEVINLLLSNYGFNENDKQKALTAACYGGHKNVIKLLAKKTVPLKDIVAACVSDNVAYFINSQKSSDINAPVIESIGLTPLMIASSCGSDGVVKVLVKSGADVNKQDSYLKYSPLLYAVSGSGSKSVSVVQYLLNCGANVNIMNTMNQTPLDIAKLTELNDIAEILKRSGSETYSAIMEVMPQKVEETVQKIYVLKAMMSVVNFATQTVAASAMASLLSTSQIFSVAQMVPFVTPVDAMSPFNAETPFPTPTCRHTIEVC